MMYDEVLDWIIAILGSEFLYSRGTWTDDPSNQDEFIVALFNAGGPMPSAGDRTAVFRIIMLGPQRRRDAVMDVQESMKALMDVVIEADVVPCGACHIRAVGEPVGPAYTTEDRAWYSVNIQVLF